MRNTLAKRVAMTVKQNFIILASPRAARKSQTKFTRLPSRAMWFLKREKTR